MDKEKIIEGLKSLVYDRESFITENKEDCEIFIKDRNVLLAAVDYINNNNSDEQRTDELIDECKECPEHVCRADEVMEKLKNGKTPKYNELRNRARKGAVVMSEEEKKAIEVLKNKRPSEQMLISGKMCVDILINLITKQQEEINNSVSKDKIREDIEENNRILEEKYSAEKISIFNGDTYMQKFKLLGKNEALNKLLEE